MKNFKNIFFDLGGVLFNLNPRVAFRNLHELGIPMPTEMYDDDKPLYTMPKGHELLSLISEVDKGNVRAPQFIEIIKSYCKPGVTEQQIRDAYNSMLFVPASRLALLKRLRSKYKVFLLSNIGDIHWEEAKRQAAAAGYPMEDCFDYCFCSFELGVAKPDPAIFRRVIELSGVDPSESLYIDDFVENIKAGNDAGFIAYQIVGNTLEEHVPVLFPDMV